MPDGIIELYKDKFGVPLTDQEYERKYRHPWEGYTYFHLLPQANAHNDLVSYSWMTEKNDFALLIIEFTRLNYRYRYFDINALHAYHHARKNFLMFYNLLRYLGDLIHIDFIYPLWAYKLAVWIDADEPEKILQQLQDLIWSTSANPAAEGVNAAVDITPTLKTASSAAIVYQHFFDELQSIPLLPIPTDPLFKLSSWRAWIAAEKIMGLHYLPYEKKIR